jgi:hypothetical protein
MSTKQLTNSVAQEPKGYHRTHNSPPPVPVLRQLNPIQTPQANLPKIHSDPIFPPTPWSSQWSLSLGQQMNKLNLKSSISTVQQKVMDLDSNELVHNLLEWNF